MLQSRHRSFDSDQAPLRQTELVDGLYRGALVRRFGQKPTVIDEDQSAGPVPALPSPCPANPSFADPVGPSVWRAATTAIRIVGMSHRREDNTDVAEAIFRAVPNLVTTLGTSITLESGRTLPLDFKTNDTSIYVLSSGLCLSEWTPEKSRRRILDLFCPGDVIQPATLLPLPGTKIVSATLSRLQRIKMDALDSLIERDPLFFNNLLEQFTKNQQRKTVHISSLGGLSAEARVAVLFIELSLRMSADKKDQTGFQIPLSRQDIADYLALNADTLSRIISRYKSEGLLQQVGRDKIYIKDWDALRARCPISEALVSVYTA